MSESLSDASLRVAAVQRCAGTDKCANIVATAKLVACAARRGARVVLLPEKWNGFGSGEVFRACAEDLNEGASVDAMRGWAREHGVYLVGGSITERCASGELMNTCLVFDPDGSLIASYRKMHLFDVEVGGRAIRESDHESAGSEIVTVELDGWVAGLSICYDLRFPELYRILTLSGATILLIPSAFTMATGRDHWELLLRARAVENQCYVVAADDFGRHPGRGSTFGRSMVVDPWGTVLAQAGDRETVVLADLDAEHLVRVRESLPALTHRRPDRYVWPNPAA